MSVRARALRACGGVLVAAAAACGGPFNSIPSPGPTVNTPAAPAPVDRELRIPAEAVKMTPETDAHPPVVYSSDYSPPIPVPGRVNTAGAEDSPFVLPDGNTLYFFFTPDVKVPVQQQVLDGVTGIYVSHRDRGEWGEPDRIVLQDPGRAASDGCEFVQGDVMWFCSVREGYGGVHWFTARRRNGVWQDWTLAEFDPNYQVGEFHISADGSELYFGSKRPGGRGGLDIWVSNMAGGAWQEPVNVAAVNTDRDEGWPALNPTEDELWFTRDYGLWRSTRVGGAWQEAELIVSPLAGEPTIDDAGNVYFVHHFYRDDTMIEADIYVAYKQ